MRHNLLSAISGFIVLSFLLVACQTSESLPVAPTDVPVEISIEATAVSTMTSEEFEALNTQAASEAVAEAESIQTEQEAQNLRLVQQFYDEFAAGKPEVILEIHPETITMHYAGSSEEVPTQVLYEDLAAIKAANPDLQAQIHSMFAAGDYVFTELTWGGTHTGEFFGIPATGNPVLHNGIVMRRLDGGQIVESWEMWDDLAFLNSLGFVPTWDEIIAGPPTAVAPAETTTLPILSLETLAGTWRQYDEEAQGYNWLVITPDGTYQGKHVPSAETGILVIEGTYSLAENVLTLTDPTDCPDGESYNAQFINQTNIRLDLKESSCDEPHLPEKRVWQQFEQ